MQVKDPDARLDYAVDWSTFLSSHDPPDTITGAAWVQYDEDLTVDDEGLDGDRHVAFVSGGVVNKVYRLTSRITTTAGRIQDQTFALIIRET